MTMDRLTSAAVKAKARELGFDACGVASAADHPELRFFDEWLERGWAGEGDSRVGFGEATGTVLPAPAH